MKVVLFYHSIVSDWNHGNAHFLRGVVSELQGRGIEVAVMEPADGWSRRNLIAEQGPDAPADFEARFPHLRPILYDAATDLDRALDGADLVIVHEWTDPQVARAIARRRVRGGRFTLLFHDTHHRAITAPRELDSMALDAFDGVLAYGNVLRETYLKRGWGRRVWTWHEAADTRLFAPRPGPAAREGLIWIGNWGDDERTTELREFLIDPAAALNLRTTVHGVRYPPTAVGMLERHGIRYAGWIANHRVPEAFAQHRVTVHIPRRPYARELPGIPTIRVFEALACGIPLVSAPWDDIEGLFGPDDFLTARNGLEMRGHLRGVVSDPALAAELARNGLRTIRARHTCAHRVDELVEHCRGLGLPWDAAPSRERQVA